MLVILKCATSAPSAALREIARPDVLLMSSLVVAPDTEGVSAMPAISMVMVLADRVEVGAAVGGAAIVLHLEGEAGVAYPMGVGERHEFELAGIDICDRD